MGNGRQLPRQKSNVTSSKGLHKCSGMEPPAGPLEKPKSSESKTSHLTVASAPVSRSPITSITNTQNTIQSNEIETQASVQSTQNEHKYKVTITSERFMQLKKIVEDAIRDRRTFTIKGGWHTLRNALLSRNWIEKFENSSKSQAKPVSLQASLDDVCVNLPNKQDWETATAHKEKCERTIMSRLLNMHEVDFYWNQRKDSTDWHHRCCPLKLMNRFNRSLFTSKEGLCLLLNQMYWHCEPGVSDVNFPRCYVLGFPEHYDNFVDDFRITSCICLLKWFAERPDDYSAVSPEGTVSFSALQFAIVRCNEFIASQKHLDIDTEPVKVWDHEWDQFLSQYYQIVHKNGRFVESKEHNVKILSATSKLVVRDFMKYSPQCYIDGVKNIWIIKPGNKCRGRGIQLVRTVEDVSKMMNLKVKYVVQKYIERPLIIYKTKFDVRQWFMITCVQPLTIWMYRDSYLRFSSQIFSLENFHESLHLTNHAVQCKYTNVSQRDKALPDENMWDCHTFKSYLKQIGQSTKWDEVIYPGMRESIVGSMLACQETMDRRPNTYELYGVDFILTEDFKPWMLEINSCPDLSSSTSVTARMCPQLLEDVVKVLIDRRKDPRAETGLFECVYRQVMPRAPAYLGMSLCVRGRKLFKTKKNKTGESKKNKKEEAKDTTPKYITTLISPGLYKGPVIHDLIEELNSLCDSSNDTDTLKGIDFASPVHVPPPPKKKNNGAKIERVSRRLSRVKSKSNDVPFTNRNSSAKESSTPAVTVPRSKSRLVRSNYVSLLQDWQSRRYESSHEKTELWHADTSSILKGKNILAKLHYDNLESKIKFEKTPNVSPLSWHNIFPNYNGSNHNHQFQGSANFLTVGLSLQNLKPVEHEE